MVLKVKDFTWNQNNEFIFVNIPLKGKTKNDVDIILTDNYIKVNFTPYIFECFLLNEIDDIKTKFVIIDGILVLHLRKKFIITWTTLNNNIYDDKEMASKKRLLEIEKYESNIKDLIKINADKKSEGNKYSLREMMQLESQEKKIIKDYKENETQKALEELEEWKKSQISSKILKINERDLKTEDENQKYVVKENINYTNNRNIFCDDESSLIDPIRKCGKIEISFTPRVFPTPERESVKPQEDEWLQKQMDIKQQQKIKVTADMKPEECNPDWLKSKGNALFAVGDYGGALAAYTMGIEINPDLYELYSNRSACHIKMRNFFKAIDDSTKSLELLNPPVAQNLKSRIKAYLRRGAAFLNLQMYTEGLSDYEMASKLDPDNETIRNDMSKLKLKLIS